MGKNQACVSSLDGSPYANSAPGFNVWKGTWQWDIRTDTTLWSEGLYRIIGRENTTIPPFREHFRFYTSESWIRLVDATLKSLKTGTSYELILEMLHANGSRRWVIRNGEPLENEQGEIVELRGTVEDITEQDITEWGLQAGNVERGSQTESNADDATRRLIQAQEEENVRLVTQFHANICQKLALLAETMESFKSALSHLPPPSDMQIEALTEETVGILGDLDQRVPGVAPTFND